VIVRLYGVWQGKGAPDWDDERLKITVEPSNTPLEQALQAHDAHPAGGRKPVARAEHCAGGDR